ncbi:MAG: helix-turn-helix domain-containing protein, partial [Nitriliruptoraceae bacterium]
MSAPPTTATAIDARTAAAWQRDYDRIARAIAWLDAHQHEQPRLGELAAALHLSPGHLQRTFTRFAGTSPSRFLRWLSAAAARELLEQRATVLDATSRTGVSSGGRLHDLLVTIDAVTPGDIGRGGEGLTIRTAVHPTPLGPAAVAVTERGVLSLSFPDPPAHAGSRPAAATEASPGTSEGVREGPRGDGWD